MSTQQDMSTIQRWLFKPLSEHCWPVQLVTWWVDTFITKGTLRRRRGLCHILIYSYTHVSNWGILWLCLCNYPWTREEKRNSCCQISWLPNWPLETLNSSTKLPLVLVSSGMDCPLVCFGGVTGDCYICHCPFITERIELTPLLHPVIIVPVRRWSCPASVGEQPTDCQSFRETQTPEKDKTNWHDIQMTRTKRVKNKSSQL